MKNYSPTELAGITKKFYFFGPNRVLDPKSSEISADSSERSKQARDKKLAKKPFQWSGKRPDDPAHEMLVAFLVMDIQHNSQWARELAQRAESVGSGRLAVWERIGNAYRLELTTEGAWIEDLVDETAASQLIPLAEFSTALDAWIKAIS